MPKLEFDFEELGQAAYEGFHFDVPGAASSWSGMSAEEQEPWQQAGIAVVKLFAGRVDELMDRIEAEKAAGVEGEEKA